MCVTRTSHLVYKLRDTVNENAPVFGSSYSAVNISCVCVCVCGKKNVQKPASILSEMPGQVSWCLV